MSRDLTKFDFIVAIDKSGSMSSPGRFAPTRWDEGKELAAAVARKAASFDSDGITVIPFANTYKVYDGVTADKVDQVFAENEPMGGTDTAGVLTAIFNRYKENKKPFIAVVVTDGEPNDRDAVAHVIREFASTLTDNGNGDTDDAGILFLQVGNDPAATKFLRDLDDNLNAKFDIVDMKTSEDSENMSIVELLNAALDD
jgi:hypothetical protein